MEEFGQPMHAYDLSTISGNEIVVNTAKDGDEFVTLDGQTRKLDENILMINDGEKPVGIAGIMGGENSMITENVKDVLFEAACFDGTNIRLSSKKLGMRTDASSKFEKGLDPNLALVAMNRACQLIEELGVGEVVGGAIDIYPVKREGVKIPFEPEKYNKLLGTDIDKDTMISYFKKIDLVYNAQTNEIEVPSWRQDLLCDADIAEEVIRFYGYDKVPTTLPNGQSTTGKISFKHYIEKMLKNTVEHCGFSQGMTYSFESPKVFDKLLLDKDDESRKAIKIANPLGEDYSIMRTLSVNGMMTSLSTNFGRRNQNVRLYELGNVYLPKQLPITELPDEKMKLTLGMYGEGDFFDMKGFIEEVFESVGMRYKVEYSPESKLNFLHPGRQANVIYNGEVIGYIGEVHPIVASNYAIKGRVYLAVLDMESITKNASFDYKYKQIVNFPASTRDLSMVVPKDVLVGDIEKIFDQRGGKYLESYKLFDIYEGEQIKEGFKSVAYSLVFRGKEKNLEENDITKAMKKILNGLEGLGIELRA
jgi:phenylalanyl-tRNA synthetase beta chain